MFLKPASAFLVFAMLTPGHQASGDSGKMESISLPSPKYSSAFSLEEAIYQRRSVRFFRDEALKIQEISQLLWAAGGKTGTGLTGASRSCPSAGGIYPLEIYLVAGKVEGLKAGIYRYYWQDHTVRLLKPGDYRASLAEAALSQEFIERAPATLVITAIYRKTARVYGERGIVRYVHMDAGHAAQNVYLQAAALGLGTVSVGAFHDQAVKNLLDLDQEDPLYILPLGRPLHD